MAKFFIGQRVRKARGNIPENIGLTGTVVGIDLLPKGTQFRDAELGFASDLQVSIDRPAITHGRINSYIGNFCIHSRDTTETVPAGTIIPCDSSEWEPILPEGLESEDEIRQLYTPEPMEISV